MQNLSIVDVHPGGPTCVQSVPMFAGLTPQQQSLVASLAKPKRFSSGELIQGIGEEAAHVGVVHKGQVKISRLTPSGRSRLVRVAGPTETIGEHGFLTSGHSVHEARAVADTQLCVFSYEDLAELLHKYPDVALRMMRATGERLAKAEHRLALGSLSVPVRVADYLLDLPVSEASPEGIVVRLPLPKKDIASLLGTTPETFSRTLLTMVESSLISVDGPAITLLDLDALEEMVNEA